MFAEHVFNQLRSDFRTHDTRLMCRKIQASIGIFRFFGSALIRSRIAGPPSPIGWEKEFFYGTVTQGGVRYRVLTLGYFLSALQAFNLCEFVQFVSNFPPDAA